MSTPNIHHNGVVRDMLTAGVIGTLLGTSVTYLGKSVVALCTSHSAFLAIDPWAGGAIVAVTFSVAALASYVFKDIGLNEGTRYMSCALLSAVLMSPILHLACPWISFPLVLGLNMGSTFFAILVYSNIKPNLPSQNNGQIVFNRQ